MHPGRVIFISAVVAVLAFVIGYSLGLQARKPPSAPQILNEQLPRNWTWRIEEHSFDSMYRQKGEKPPALQ